MKVLANRNPRRRRFHKRRGTALLFSFMILTLLGVGASSYVASATQTYQTAFRESLEIQTTPLCEAGADQVKLNLWTPFKESQNFTLMDAACIGASPSNVMSKVSGIIPVQW